MLIENQIANRLTCIVEDAPMLDSEGIGGDESHFAFRAPVERTEK